MDYITVINGLLPLVSNLAPVVAAIIMHIRTEQPNLTVDEILTHAQLTLDDAQKALIAEQVRLQEEINAAR